MPRFFLGGIDRLRFSKMFPPPPLMPQAGSLCLFCFPRRVRVPGSPAAILCYKRNPFFDLSFLAAPPFFPAARRTTVFPLFLSTHILKFNMISPSALPCALLSVPSPSLLLVFAFLSIFLLSRFAPKGAFSPQYSGWIAAVVCTCVHEPFFPPTRGFLPTQERPPL